MITSTEKKKKFLTIGTMTQIGFLSAMAFILMLIEFPVPFAPPFYKIDLSEVPVVVGGFLLGPLAGVVIEFIKILLFLLIRQTQTAGVGELANFLIGISLVVPAAFIYKKKKTVKTAAVGMVTGTLFMTVVGCFLNAFLLIPFYSVLLNIPIESITAFTTLFGFETNSIFPFVAAVVAPFNLLKGFIVTILVCLMHPGIKAMSRIANRANR